MNLSNFVYQQSRFTKCAICEHLREQLSAPGLTPEERTVSDNAEIAFKQCGNYI